MIGDKKVFVDFWNSWGNDHEVSEWEQKAEGREIISYFEKMDKSSNIFSNCKEFNKCLEKYEKSKNGSAKQGEEQNYEFDESKVNWKELKEPYYVGMYIALSNYPKWFLSNNSKNNIGFIMREWNNGRTVIGISLYAQKKYDTQNQKTVEEKAKINPNENNINEEEKTNNKKSGNFYKVFAWIGEHARKSNKKHLEETYGSYGNSNSRESNSESKSHKPGLNSSVEENPDLRTME